MIDFQPGTVGKTAKRLAVNVGDGAMSSAATHVTGAGWRVKVLLHLH